MCGLRPGVCGLRPGMCGLRPGVCGLRSVCNVASRTNPAVCHDFTSIVCMSVYQLIYYSQKPFFFLNTLQMKSVMKGHQFCQENMLLS